MEIAVATAGQPGSPSFRSSALYGRGALEDAAFHPSPVIRLTSAQPGFD